MLRLRAVVWLVGHVKKPAALLSAVPLKMAA